MHSVIRVAESVPYVRVEHLIAKQHRGSTILTFFALPAQSATGPRAPIIQAFSAASSIPLFHPRKQSWKRHFRWDNTVLVGKTFSGKFTVQVLDTNDGTSARSR